MALVNNEVEYPKYEELLTEQLLHAQAHIWNHTFSFINSMSLKCAIELGIPNIIHNHGSPISISQLVDALPIDTAKSHCIHRLMRILTHSNFFVKLHVSGVEEECYWLTPSTRLLLRDGKPFTLAPFALHIMDPIMTKACGHVSEWFVSENHGSPFEVAHQITFWEFVEQNSRSNNIFNKALSSDSRFFMHILLKECKQVFEGVRLLVDVGGGVGTTSKAIVEALPDMKCIVLDLPHVVVGLEGTENITFIGGDMFKSIPSGDAVFLKWIFYDWNDDDSVEILKKCKQAITNKTKGGRSKVIIVDMVIMEDTSKEIDNAEMKNKLFLDMAMMAWCNSKERSEKEWAKLFMDAGFTSYNIISSLGMMSLIEVYP